MPDFTESEENASLSDSPVTELTFREWEVLLLISEDRGNKDIAVITSLKIESIRSMRNRIGDKLMLKGHNTLAQFARQHRRALRQLFQVLFLPRRCQ
ncbi:LuxR C-terminal-related transcriptional regulator [Dyadobacter arcticus]|uniref:DNA-binding NarL/FixJ family response regulator n=1 Tax=Dyadobacter arcticus TaxID=1078754 RepID=A0ABX0UKK8_9BACT|nr:LuxR C-terminal-related transcriptional regulator [Dyadobacter arcticus]NIJ51666.1 DNA-binding NarL/FixJ family response regulator [Dyadobacter arcticus]